MLWLSACGWGDKVQPAKSTSNEKELAETNLMSMYASLANSPLVAGHNSSELSGKSFQKHMFLFFLQDYSIEDAIWTENRVLNEVRNIKI